jgi:hypothetical protein
MCKRIKFFKPFRLPRLFPQGISMLWFPGLILSGLAGEVTAANLVVATTQAQPGATVTLGLRFVDPLGAPAGAFALWLSNSPALGIPTAAAGPDQSNLIVFVDATNTSLCRVTGFVLNDPALSTGVVATLTWHLPTNIPPGTYSVTPASSPSPNPEWRTYSSNEPMSGTALGGWIQVMAPGFNIQVISRTVSGVASLSWSNAPGSAFTVLAATNPAVPMVQWEVLGAATESPAGQFQFQDGQATNYPRRFYRLRTP